LSEIRANTISAANGTGPVALTKQMASKQWCRWNHTGTAAINDSFNTSSLTDNGTGRGQLAYTSNMADGNYHLSTAVGELTGGGNRGIGVRGTDKTPSTDGCAYLCFNTNWSPADQDLCSASIHGDLA
jgi:hypothetical protein